MLSDLAVHYGRQAATKRPRKAPMMRPNRHPRTTSLSLHGVRRDEAREQGMVGEKVREQGGINWRRNRADPICLP
jgi:hypothetical protein